MGTESAENAGGRRWQGVHKALADPLRVRLLETLWQAPQSARELAERVETPADRLYYHLHQLAEAGLIVVTGHRPLPRGKVERVYAPAAAEPPPDEPASPREMARFLGAMLEATRADIDAAYRSRETGARREVALHRGALRLTDEALDELQRYVGQLAERCAAEQSGGEPGTWTRVVVALVDLQDRPPPGSGTPVASEAAEPDAGSA
ncbi:ArsR/SmtB family transcription factor [Actinacidiphila acidipaludis]|uniref:Helix-turn-helix domain-containing protein n=1 Tax=Actinacidiphila acidipaludis TaxID=2873382 RepID=A0ABS7QGG8_9ACTN|nr:winged helix-turn-helix domain-containing protein [Streptomyces acidipaludis]MBY8882262.1 helix-turn-helix domain-containing protein [Streptomyces acidipaludis]